MAKSPKKTERKLPQLKIRTLERGKLRGTDKVKGGIKALQLMVDG